MERYIVSYEQAQMLKQLGFDWKVEDWYWIRTLRNSDPEVIKDGGIQFIANNYNSPEFYIRTACSAPQLHITQKWLIEHKKVIVLAQPYWNKGALEWEGVYFWESYYRHPDTGERYIEPQRRLCRGSYKEYEHALSAAITDALKYLIKYR